METYSAHLEMELKEESDLLQFDARRIVSRMLNQPEDKLFPIQNGRRIQLRMSAHTLESPLSGRVDPVSDLLKVTK